MTKKKKKRPQVSLHPPKKNNFQETQYCNTLANTSIQIEDTIKNDIAGLDGSDSFSNSDKSEREQDEAKKAPVGIRVLKWVKRHLVLSLIAPLIVLYIGWLSRTTYLNDKELAYYSGKLEIIQNTINLISEVDSSVNELEKEVEVLKVELVSTHRIDFLSIENRIDSIEEKVRDCFRK